MSFKRETEKIVLLQVKGLMHIILKFRAEKYLHISIIHRSTFWEGHHHLILSLGPKFCAAIKERIESLYFPEGKQIWYVLQIAKALFSYSICLMISDEIIMLCYALDVSLSCWCKQVPRISGNKAYKTFAYKSFQFF